MTRIILLLSGATTVAACGDPCPSGAPAIELGTGQDAFEPLAPGDPIDMYWGPQGGYHVFASIEATNVGLGDGPGDLKNPWVSVQLRVGGQTMAQIQSIPRVFQGNRRQSLLIGDLVIFTHPDPPSLDGEPAEMEAWVRDRCDQTPSTLVDVVLRLVQ